MDIGEERFRFTDARRYRAHHTPQAVPYRRGKRLTTTERVQAILGKGVVDKRDTVQTQLFLLLLEVLE